MTLNLSNRIKNALFVSLRANLGLNTVWEKDLYVSLNIS